MKETVTGGKREFVYSVIWAVFLLFVSRFLIFLLPAYKIIGSIAALLMFCVLGFFVMTRYAAVYTYELKGQTIRVNRSIGKHNKEAEARICEIEYFGRKRPADMPKFVYTMRSSVFKNKRTRYIVYKRKKNRYGLVIEPSDAFLKEIESLLKEKD